MAVEAKSQSDLDLERLTNEANQVNASRSGVGTRVFTGKTRGKGSIAVKWEQFDDSKPETLPTSIAQFSEVTKVSDEPTLLSYLIEGYNQASYTAASDPLAEFVNPAWPDDAQTQFRLVVRNYARGANVSIEDAVNLIKPGFDKQFSPSAK